MSDVKKPKNGSKNVVPRHAPTSTGGTVRVIDTGASYVPVDFDAQDDWSLDEIAAAFADGYDFGDGSTATLRRREHTDSGSVDVHVVREGADGEIIEDANYMWEFDEEDDSEERDER